MTPALASLVPARRIGPLAMSLATVVILVEYAMIQPHDATAGALVSFVPSMAIVWCTAALVDKQWARAIGGVFGAVTLHTFLACLLFGVSARYFLDLFLGAALVFALHAVVAMPMIFASLYYSARRDHEAGDSMLCFSGVWGSFLQLVVLIASGGIWSLVAPGLATSLMVVAFAAERIHRRRAFCRRIERGEVEGYRVRPAREGEGLDHLPSVFNTWRKGTEVIEAVHVSQVVYRDGPIGMPIATLRRKLVRG